MIGLESYLRTHTQLDEAQMAHIVSLAIPRTLRRNELLLQEGQVCRHKTFVVSGLLRNYGMGADMQESILQFSPENSWTLDVESYDNGTPAKFNIAAVERAELLSWTKTDFDLLMREMPELRAFSQQLIARNIHSSRQRLLTALSGTPEEKYEDFVRSFPDLLPRLPLHMIASYLGMSLKTLTRIRHAQLPR